MKHTFREKLTSRQKQLVSGLALGMTSEEIANWFVVEANSIDRYTYRLRKDLSASSNPQLIEICLRKNLITHEEIQEAKTEIENLGKA